jgi:hypothetical protein
MRGATEEARMVLDSLFFVVENAGKKVQTRTRDVNKDKRSLDWTMGIWELQIAALYQNPIVCHLH